VLDGLQYWIGLIYPVLVHFSPLPCLSVIVGPYILYGSSMAPLLHLIRGEGGVTRVDASRNWIRVMFRAGHEAAINVSFKQSKPKAIHQSTAVGGEMHSLAPK
jgi:hypothetical protein